MKKKRGHFLAFVKWKCNSSIGNTNRKEKKTP